MSQIAIDIVLIPDEGIQKVCRDINQNIAGKIDFINTRKIPHISLMMGGVDEKNLEEIYDILAEITQNFSQMYFTGNLRKYTIHNTGETGYSYELEENPEIKKLFSEIAQKIRPRLSYKSIITDIFFQPEQVEDQSCVWVKGFENRSEEEYSSHITLGIGELEGEYPNMVHFSAPKLAVFQLGNYCTCENKLFEITL